MKCFRVSDSGKGITTELCSLPSHDVPSSESRLLSMHTHFRPLGVAKHSCSHPPLFSEQLLSPGNMEKEHWKSELNVPYSICGPRFSQDLFERYSLSHYKPWLYHNSHYKPWLYYNSHYKPWLYYNSHYKPWLYYNSHPKFWLYSNSHYKPWLYSNIH